MNTHMLTTRLNPRVVEGNGGSNIDISRLNNATEQRVVTPTGVLNHADFVVRMRAAHALGETRSEDKSIVPALTKALEEDPDADVRYVAARALGKIGGPEAVPALTGALGDFNGAVRGEALRALQTIERAR